MERMTAQAHNRFVFCAVVVEIAENGGSMSTISHQNTFSQKIVVVSSLKGRIVNNMQR